MSMGSSVWSKLWRHGTDDQRTRMTHCFVSIRHCFLAVALLLLFQPLLAQDSHLPDLGSAARHTFSQQTEATLSLAFLESLYRYTDINTDPELNSYVRQIGQALLRHVRSERRYQFYLINDDSINAFAGPGGIIGINTGLILSAKTEDEIAAVLAHEIQHVEQEHISRMFDQQQKGLLPTLAGIVGALLVGSQSPQAAMALMTGSIAYQMEQQLAFSRDHEWEADRLGIDLLAAAGYDPNAMADFFATLMNRYRTFSKGSELLQTHPVTEKRISDSKDKANKITRKAAKHRSIDLALAQARLEALAQRPSSHKRPEVLCYQQSVTHWLKQEPDSPCTNKVSHLWQTLIELSTAEASAKTQAQWQGLLDIYPQNLAVWLRYADYLMDHQQPEQLIQLLLPQTDRHSENFDIWMRIAKAYYVIEDEAASAWALSKGYAATGQFKQSRVQLDKAKTQQEKSAHPTLKIWIENQVNWLELKEKERKTLE